MMSEAEWEIVKNLFKIVESLALQTNDYFSTMYNQLVDIKKQIFSIEHVERDEK